MLPTMRASSRTLATVPPNTEWNGPSTTMSTFFICLRRSVLPVSIKNIAYLSKEIGIFSGVSDCSRVGTVFDVKGFIMNKLFEKGYVTAGAPWKTCQHNGPQNQLPVSTSRAVLKGD